MCVSRPENDEVQNCLNNRQNFAIGFLGADQAVRFLLDPLELAIIDVILFYRRAIDDRALFAIIMLHLFLCWNSTSSLILFLSYHILAFLTCFVMFGLRVLESWKKFDNQPFLK